MIRLVGLALLIALAGCKIKNELSCELAENQDLAECGGTIDAPPMACGDTMPCATGVCSPDNVCVECLVNADCMDAAEPTCDPDHSCRACVAHTDCDSDACLPNGQCASDVAYVAMGGAGDCSQGSPCGTIDQAFATGRAVIKVDGTGAVPLTARLTIDQGKVRTLLGDPGATISASFADALFVILDPNTSLTMVGLRVLGNPSSGDGFSVGAKARLDIERSTIQGLGVGGVAVRAANVDTEVEINRSIIARNTGGAINIQNANVTLRNNLIVQNGSAGMNTRGLEMNPGATAVLEFNTIAENVGIANTAINCSVPFPAANNIVFGNTTAINPTCTFTFSLFEGATPPPGMGNQVGAPLKFVDRASVDGAGYFRITADSEAIDKAGPSAITDDIDGTDTRPTGVGDARDIGADERP